VSVEKKNLNLKLPTSQLDEWNIVCKKLGLSKSQMVSQLLDDILPLFRDEKNLLSNALRNLGKSVSDIAEVVETKKNVSSK